jgi:hypothetical protein
MKYWWPFIIFLSLYGWYKVFKLWSKYPNGVSWQAKDEVEKDEM